MYRQTGHKDEELSELEAIPEDCQYLWTHYMELRGSDHLSHSEIESWMNVTGNRLKPYEVAILKDLSAVEMESRYADA